MNIMNKLLIKNRHNLKISLVTNEHPSSKGIVFIIHGLGGFKEQPHIQLVTQIFFSAGYTTIVFDTTNSIGESEGKYEDATLSGSYTDLEDVIQWSKNQLWYKEPFCLAGHSMGGYSVVRFAEEYPEIVKGVFAWAPVVSGELSYKSSEREVELAEWKRMGYKTRISNSKPGLELRLPWSHMVERLNHNLLPQAHKLTMPLLIVVGEEDTSCPPAHEKILFDAIPLSKKELVIIPKAPHTFRDEKHLEQLTDYLTSWLSKLDSSI